MLTDVTYGKLYLNFTQSMKFYAFSDRFIMIYLQTYNLSEMHTFVIFLENVENFKLLN